MPAAGAGSGGTTAGGPTAATGAGGEAAESYQVTLITGDVVTWRVMAGGRVSATIDEAGKGETTSFQTIESGEDYYVIPSDVALLLDNTLDRELFNVAGLVEQGYHDTEIDALPVIVTGARTFRTTRAATVGLTVEQPLGSIGGFAGAVEHEDAADFGDALADAAAAKGRMRTTSLAGVDRIWLDHRVEVSLEESVPQTGAPDAWAAGYDGTGTTIAVLDTGVDKTHPDIGDKVVAEANFSDGEGVADDNGHGTHVAATAAGTGDGSGGLRTGVAPGARLVNAKVLNADGNGTASGAIAGMEWAAAQDVDVINMSLGAGPTDGTDPMSQAVDSITEEHGVLFVIAAGNSGPFVHTVTSPGTADAALTVGSVNKDGQLAGTSGRGPRVGDYAIKPDITAPGVNIVAARAAGTSMGVPVDDLYTSASGTSMATPHVAGAAAILAQQHPDWRPVDLKGALVGNASPAPGLSVYNQGGGELDVTSATAADVVATPGTLDLGYFQYPHVDTGTETLTYTNHGSETVTLDIDLTMADQQGNAPAAGMVTVDPTTVTIEPGADAEVAVTVDETVGAVSLYSGSIVATDASGEPVASTPTGFFKEKEMYQLTVEGIDRDGEPATGGSRVDVVNVVDATQLNGYLYFQDGTASVRVPPGTYSVMGVINTPDATGESYSGQTMMGDPEIEVTRDTTLTWDAREATEITVDTGDGAQQVGQQLSYHRSASERGSHTNNFIWLGGDWPYSAMETEPATQGYFEFYTQYVLVDTASEPERHYDLIYPEPDAIPADLAYEVTEDNTATLHTAYHSDLPDHDYVWRRASWRPFEQISWDMDRQLQAPREQTEIVSTGDTRWVQTVRGESGQLTEPMTPYEAGEQREVTWFASPNTPSLLEGTTVRPTDRPYRDGDVLSPRIIEWGDARPGAHRPYGYLTQFDSAAFRLYEDEELIAEAPRAAFGTFQVSPGPSRIRMELDVARESDWSLTSTQTRTAWEFDSAHTAEMTPLDLLQVDYDIDLSLTNTAPHPREIRGPFTIGLDVRHPDGVDGAQIEGARAWVSYDDGGTWDRRPVRDVGDGSFRAVMNRPAGPGYASIKVEAWDAAGNTVEQEVIRAYALRGR